MSIGFQHLIYKKVKPKEDCIEYLEGKKFFTVLDLKSGFHHVKMHDGSTKYTAFVTPNGQYEYLRMPFGLKNAPSVSSDL